VRRAKIVCTLGPAVENIEKVEALIDAGMNVARLNLSHGTHKDHKNRLDLVRKVAEKKQTPVAVLIDLQGPKIRLGKFDADSYQLQLMKFLEAKREQAPLTRACQVIAKSGI
jgi:pyruvate kinase